MVGRGTVEKQAQEYQTENRAHGPSPGDGTNRGIHRAESGKQTAAKTACKEFEAAIRKEQEQGTDEDPYVRAAAAGALAEIAEKGDQQVISLVAAKLADEDRDVRAAAAGALGENAEKGAPQAISMVAA